MPRTSFTQRSGSTKQQRAHYMRFAQLTSRAPSYWALTDLQKRVNASKLPGQAKAELRRAIALKRAFVTADLRNAKTRKK